MTQYAVKHNHFETLNKHPDWYLEGFNAQGERWQIPLHTFPFRVGRLRSNDLCLSFSGVSRRHAEIHQAEQQLWLRECGSTNGTFVNHNRVEKQSALKHGDIIRFGFLEFYLCHEVELIDESENTQVLESLSQQLEAESPLDQAMKLSGMLRQRTVKTLFQPIIQFQRHRLVGYELLGRGHHPDLPEGPLDLFNIASASNQSVELSELFRDVGLQTARQLGLQQRLFINTVPQEIDHTFMAQSLEMLRRQANDLPIVLEINEKSVSSIKTMRMLRAISKDLSIDLAYDDFGAGQARLVELMKVPPDWLKFDISLIRNIHQQPPNALQVLRSLVTMARDLDIKTVAEGIEVAAEKITCQALGFEYGQGYYLSRPDPSPDIDQFYA